VEEDNQLGFEFPGLGRRKIEAKPESDPELVNLVTAGTIVHLAPLAFASLCQKMSLPTES
jgi:hypothetical protein